MSTLITDGRTTPPTADERIRSTTFTPPAMPRRRVVSLVPVEAPRRPRIVAIANQKGGVGKSTTAVNLGAALAERGVQVLLVDLDPQGNASTGVGVEPAARRPTTYEVLMGAVEAPEAVLPTGIPGMSLIAATMDLAGAEVELVNQLARESRVSRFLEPIRDRFDVILLDCPPSLGMLTVNALTAAGELLVPIQCEYYALEGLGLLLRNARLIRDNVNPGLLLTGILLTMFDPRIRLAEQVVADVRGHFPGVVYDVVVPRAVRLAEAPGFGMPITAYDPSSRAAEAYRRLAREFLRRRPQGLPQVWALDGRSERAAASRADAAALAEGGSR